MIASVTQSASSLTHKLLEEKQKLEDAQFRIQQDYVFYGNLPQRLRSRYFANQLRLEEITTELEELRKREVRFIAS